MYPADGRKLPDVYTAPADLRDELQSKLGTFPLFNFWGPKASIESSRWIAESAKHVEEKFSPTLSLVYLPHLDYNLQRVGPGDPAAAGDVRQVDDLCGDLIDFYEARGVRVVILSEYGLCDVTTPVHLNRVLRQQGLVDGPGGARPRGARSGASARVRRRGSPGRARLRQRFVKAT